MRKVLYTLIASALLAAVIPATALARGHHGRHHHARAHHKFHHKIRHKQFGRASAPATTSMSDNAGTVSSFDGHTLKIQLADGSTVSGAVNDSTEIECQAADDSQSDFKADHEGGDRSGSDQQGDRGDDDANNNNNDENDDNDNDDNNVQNCDASSLTPGAIVHEAELKLGGAGAVWEKVELLTTSGTSSSSS